MESYFVHFNSLALSCLCNMRDIDERWDTNGGKGKEDSGIHEIQLVRVPILDSLLIPGENKISICEK